MKRRDAAKIIPLATTGLLSLTKNAFPMKKDSKPLCLRYLELVREMLVKIRNTESDNLLEASYRIAKTYKNGGKCFNQWDMGHSIESDLFPNRHGDPGIFINSYDADKAKEGDTLLLSIIGSPIEDPHGKGVFVIGAPAPWGGETPKPELLREDNRNLKYRHFCDIWIDTGITTYGAIMWLPGETVPMGPVSGALGLMTFWMINADVIRILARDGTYVSVKGDEPELKEETLPPYSYTPQYSEYVSLDKPLGGEYFKEAMKQLKNIEAELGTINRIADMVVDTLLSGGSVFNYSRYPNSLCFESTNRRGGLLFNRGLCNDEKGLRAVQQHLRTDYKPEVTNKDIVIMGVYQPDDPVDLESFHSLRKRGAKIVSIGTATRDGLVPSGETVPGLSEVHLGNMCNTYGLFAVPGIERKVCPTSGLLVNQMFYAVQMQIAEKIIERTGNTPRIDANAAMEGGVEKRRLDFEIIKTRGY